MLLTSCGEKMKQIEAEIQYFNEIKVNKDASNVEKEGLMPELYELTKPLKINNTDYYFSPLSVKRVDNSKKNELEYLNKKGRNYKKINAITRAHREYFKDGKDTEIDPGLTAVSQQKIDFDAYVNQNKSKPNYFFIDFNGNLKIDGEEAPSSVEQLSKKIDKYITDIEDKNKKDKKNSGEELDKIVIVVTPNYYAAKNQTEKFDTTSTEIKISETPQPTQKNSEVKEENNNQVITPPKPTQQIASSLEDLLYKLTSTEYKDNEKETLASSGYLNYFTSNATVSIVDNNGDPVDAYPIKQYIGHIRNRNIKIRTVSRVPQSGKCSKLIVKEPN